MSDINILISQDQHSSMGLRERKKQETRWAIFDAAIRLMVVRGYDKVKIEEICQEADVSSALFFHHFSTKSSLVDAYLEINVFNVIDAKLKALPKASASEKLQVISQHLDDVHKNNGLFLPSAFSVFGSGDKRLELTNTKSGMSAVVFNIILAGQKSGEFKSDWTAEAVAISLVATWILIPLSADNSEFSPRPSSKILELVLAGLKDK